MTAAYSFTALLWRWEARETAEPGAWFFVTVPREVGDDIRDRLTGPPRGFGSVRVSVETATSRWDTSVFPDASSGCFVLPVKKAVRAAEGLHEGDGLVVTLRLRDGG